jgi:hypothetical protein
VDHKICLIVSNGCAREFLRRGPIFFGGDKNLLRELPDPPDLSGDVSKRAPKQALKGCSSLYCFPRAHIKHWISSMVLAGELWRIGSSTASYDTVPVTTYNVGAFSGGLLQWPPNFLVTLQTTEHSV